MSTVKIELSFNNGAEKLQLPVNPETFGVSTSRGYSDVEITQLGELTVIGNEKLREFNLASFFPREYNASYCEYVGFRPPWELVRQIEGWMNTGRPCRLKVSSQIYGDDYFLVINVPVTIRSFSYEERGGAVGDIYYELALKEYRFVEFKRLQTVQVAGVSVVQSPETERPDTTEKPTGYTVVSGDSLWKIAARTSIYGNADMWRRIYDANKALIGPNPNLIFPGQKLVIPR